jgi:glycosyltransferase involved in cell wall biosynthesis
MKILIVLLRRRGGVGRANGEIAGELRRMGHEVDFLYREDDMGVYSLFGSISIMRKKIKRLVKENNYDVIYTQDYSCTLPLIFPFRLYKKKHFACFCGVKTIKNRKFLPKKNRPGLLNYFTQILVHRLVGRFMGERLVVIGDQLKAIFSKSKLIYRGVNVKKFKPLNKKRDGLGWINKDIEMVSRKKLSDLCRSLKLKLYVAENIPPEKMNDFYNKCQVFVDLPRTAGFNLAWLESMAAGVPIVIGNDRGAGSFLPFDKVSDASNYINEIKEIFENPKKINYRKWIINNKLTWKDKAKELVEFFGGKNV